MLGLIPAHAGKTTKTNRRSINKTAHPRSRGENSLTETSQTIDWGSSPLTRGKQTISLRLARPHRLIPAHAGKTCTARRVAIPGWAHPRSRGENRSISRPRAGRMGSSPLTRGKRSDRTRQPCQPGLIPAHAGKTRTVCCPSWTAPAHPRSRGENASSAAEGALVAGSSPLTRGKPNHHDHPRTARGLIPAHAGKTKMSRARLW